MPTTARQEHCGRRTALHDWHSAGILACQVRSARWAEVERTKIVPGKQAPDTRAGARPVGREGNPRHAALPARWPIPTPSTSATGRLAAAERSGEEVGAPTEELHRLCRAELSERAAGAGREGRLASLKPAHPRSPGKNVALDWLRAQGPSNDAWARRCTCAAGAQRRNRARQPFEAVLVDDPAAQLRPVRLGQAASAYARRSHGTPRPPVRWRRGAGPAPLRALLARVRAVRSGGCAGAVATRGAEDSVITRRRMLGKDCLRVLRSGDRSRRAGAKPYKQLRAQIEALRHRSRARKR